MPPRAFGEYMVEASSCFVADAFEQRPSSTGFLIKNMNPNLSYKTNGITSHTKRRTITQQLGSDKQPLKQNQLQQHAASKQTNKQTSTPSTTQPLCMYITFSIAHHNEASVHQQLAQSVKFQTHAQTHTNHHQTMNRLPKQSLRKHDISHPHNMNRMMKASGRYAKEGHDMAQKNTHPLTVIIDTTKALP